jgi:copper(I)-binding protein
MIRRPTPTVASLAVVLFLAAFPVFARQGPLPIRIEAAWVRAVPPSVTDTAAFMRIVNTGPEPIRLVGATTALASMAMPMATTRRTVDGVEVLGMKAVDGIEIPPYSGHELKPGGDHLMIMNLTAHPHPGDIVSITLKFEPGDRALSVQMPAKIDQEP